MSKEIIIIGGGIIGLSTAYYLQKEGCKVTVVDQTDISEGASFVNAGYISPSHIIPLAAPGMITTGLKMMFNSASPFYVKPRFDSDFLKWSLAFKKSSTESKVARAIPVIKEINLLSKELYTDIYNNDEFDFQFERKGLLMYYQTEKAGEKEMKTAKRAAEVGLETELLSLEEIKKIEPNVNLNVKGAIYYKCDAHMTPGEFMSQMTTYLKGQNVIFYTNERVVDMTVQADKVATVLTDKRKISADEVVIAAGSWSPLLAKKIGITLLVQAGKGYRINVKRPTGITIPSLLMEAKVGVTPMNGFTRFAGTMELAGINHKINPVRVKAIANAAENYFNGLKIEPSEINDAACGLRPVSPDGLPYIGRVGTYKNLSIATGHAMMGWSLGPATGKLIAEILTGRKTSMDTTPFNPKRKF
jgi:D-amino-acid dehydrogenase